MTSKNKPKRTNYKNRPSPLNEAKMGAPTVDKPKTTNNETGYQFPYQRLPLIILFFVITFAGASFVLMRGGGSNIKEFGFEEIAKYKHDSSAFTQGLYYDGEFLWESTGIDRDFMGNVESGSSIRRCDLKTGTILKKVDIPDVFCEGLTRIDDRLIQLTWQDKVGFVYDLDLNKTQEFKLDFEGWGLTYDEKHLIVSDGTSKLRYLDPKSFEIKKEIDVRTGRRRFMGQLNELEFIGGKIYANAWKEDYVYIIDADTGMIESRIDLRKLFPRSKRVANDNAVLNGIAFNPNNGNLLLTGKLWPYIFEVKLVDLE